MVKALLGQKSLFCKFVARSRGKGVKAPGVVFADISILSLLMRPVVMKFVFCKFVDDLVAGGPKWERDFAVCPTASSRASS